MHSTFYHVPLRDMFVRRVLWNMPKIRPQDYRTEQTLPDSPSLPLTPPSPPIPSEPAKGAYSKRRRRPRIEPKMEFEPAEPDAEPPEMEISSPKLEPVIAKAGGVPWVPVPESSPKEKLKEVQEKLQQDSDVCRLCGDTFCRDPTYGDPYLIECGKCGGNYHSFCVDTKPIKAGWRCYKCMHSPKPVPAIEEDNDPSLQCQFCHRNVPGKLAGKLLVYRGLGNPRTNVVHENCAYYSKGVTKKEGQWFGMHSAIRESLFTKCAFCHSKGASIPCDFPKCRKLLHYPCAKNNECYLVSPDSQRFFCDQHMGSILKNPNMLTTPTKPPLLPPTPPPPLEITTTPLSVGKKSQKIIPPPVKRSRRLASHEEGDVMSRRVK